MKFEAAGPEFHRVTLFSGKEILRVPCEILADKLEFKTGIGVPDYDTMILIEIVRYSELLHQVEPCCPCPAEIDISEFVAADYHLPVVHKG